MRDRRRRRSGLSWLAVGAAVLGAATLAAKLRRQNTWLQADGVGDPTAQIGRGRTATPPSLDARRAGHETEDMRGGLMGRLVFLLGAVGVCMVLAMVGLRYWVTQAHLSDQPKLTAQQTTVVTPPLPHLQTDPVADLARHQARDATLLGGYAYTDESRTHARIPIDRAMALTVGQGLEPPP